MTEKQIESLREALVSYETLLGNYARLRENLLRIRRGAEDHVMLEIDERLEANDRVTQALRGARESTAWHLAHLENRPK